MASSASTRALLLLLAVFCASLSLSQALEDVVALSGGGVHGRRLMSHGDDDDDDDDGKNGHGHDGKGPSCEGDPHFTGADSSHFDFSGAPNSTYCIVSDSHFHMNALFGGYYGVYGNNPSKSITWMRKIGVLWGHHSILFEAREGPSAAYESGYMSSITVDGNKVSLSRAGEKMTFAEGRLSISWIAAGEKSGSELIDVYALDIKGVVSVIMELRPEIPHFRTPTDGTVHFDLYLPVAYVSDNCHGVLGQTFRYDHKDRLSKMKLEYNPNIGKEVVPGDNAEGYLDGKVDDYKTSGILEPDCKVNRFSHMENLDPETSLAVEMSSGVPSVLGDTASRVTLSSAGSTSRRMRKLRLMKRLRLL